MSDLRFWKPAGGSDLLFGDSEAPVIQHLDATLVFTFPELSFNAGGAYVSHAARPVASQAASDWQLGNTQSAIIESPFDEADDIAPITTSAWQSADKAEAETQLLTPYALERSRTARSVHHSEAQRSQPGQCRSGYSETLRTRLQRSSGYEEAVKRRYDRTASHQDADHSPRSALRSSFQRGVYRRSVKTATHNVAAPFDQWFTLRYQDGIVPPAGKWIRPVVPPKPPLDYTADLLFAKLRDGTANLVFGDTTSTGTVVVPVRSIYMILNNVALRRVSDGAYILPISMSLKLDVDSWTWGFSASLPASAQSLVEPSDYATPVELEVVINSHYYRVLVESISRERTFGTTSLSISGRGKSAYLDTPYAPVQNFTNSIDRTAQQLMNDALTFNNVGIGWDVAFELTDWLIPAGAWSHQGSYISALKRIAEAGGGYIQPHPTAQQIIVKPRYPSLPSEWNTADIELPSDVTTREGIEWIDAADYNGVYVSGEGQGVLAHVKRTGTSGDNLAQMIVDPLCTDAIMARQRGISVLGYTGRIANVSLRLPVLSETGVIRPGTSVAYTDNGVTRIGIVRSTQVDVGFPEVWQSIGVETHA